MNSEISGLDLPADLLQKWQRIVDLLANIMHVPSAVVTKVEPPHCTYYNHPATRPGTLFQSMRSSRWISGRSVRQ